MDLALTFDTAELAPQRQRLDNRPVYAALHSLADLRCFMAHLVYAVRNFMPVVKYPQNAVAPTRYSWAPRHHPAARDCINQWMLEEKSDIGPPDADGNAVYGRRFELCCGAIRKIGADPAPTLKFVEIAAACGMPRAFASGLAPLPPRRFMGHTLRFLDSGKPHIVAAALALGRGRIIPDGFRAFLQKMR